MFDSKTLSSLAEIVQLITKCCDGFQLIIHEMAPQWVAGGYSSGRLIFRRHHLHQIFAVMQEKRKCDGFK